MRRELVDRGREHARERRQASGEREFALALERAQVEPADAVLASYEFTAPLSSRKSLYSHVMTVNEPKGYPNLGPEFRWVFWKTPGYGDVDRFVNQGFVVVHRGPSLIVLRRSGVR